MLTDYSLRKAERELEHLVGGSGRYVDFGVRLVVVRQDIAKGTELLPGSPPLSILREHIRGGMVDTALASPAFTGPSVSPVTWYCGEDQEQILLGDPTGPTRQLVYGSEGAGKTALLAMWVGLRALEFTGSDLEIGITAPTEPRLDHAYQAILKFWPGTWHRFLASEWLFTLRNGCRVRLVSTKQQSAKEGSRVQGYNWAAEAADEMQDQTDADADIESRGRKAPKGRYRRVATCTAKDHPEWRTWKDRALSSGMWSLTRMLGTSSPFIWPLFWEEKKRTMDARDYQRRVLAMDVGPERQTYHAWDRGTNVRPRPRVGAQDVTARVLRNKTNLPVPFTLLGGNDPGKLKHVTLLLKAYSLPGERDITWWVVGELTSEAKTAEQHCVELLALVRCEWECNVRRDGDQIHVRSDPYGRSEKKPDQDVYRIFERHGINARAAQYSKTGMGNGQIKVESRIEMINRLLKDASGRTRLYVDCDDRRVPVAKRLVEALETSERNEAGIAEWERKDANDKSHWPAALAHALWPWEKEALMGHREIVNGPT